MEDKFILVRKKHDYKQKSGFKINVREDTYNLLTEWAAQTGRSMSDLAEQAVKFAEEHSVFIDE